MVFLCLLNKNNEYVLTSPCFKNPKQIQKFEKEIMSIFLHFHTEEIKLAFVKM